MVVALVAGACSRKSGGGTKLRTDADSAAYVLGMNVGMNLLRMDSTLNIEVVCRGIRDAVADNTQFTMAEAQAFYLRYVNYLLPEKHAPTRSNFWPTSPSRTELTRGRPRA